MLDLLSLNLSVGVHDLGCGINSNSNLFSLGLGILARLFLDREKNRGQEGDGKNADMDSKVQLFPDHDTVAEGQEQERHGEVVDRRLGQQHAQHVVDKGRLGRRGRDVAGAEVRSQQLSGSERKCGRCKHQVVARVESVPECADTKGGKGLQRSWLGTRGDHTEVDRVLEPLVGAHVPVVGQGLDALASLIGPDVDVRGGVPQVLPSLRILTVVAESSKNTGTFGHLPDGVVLESGSKGSELNISETEHPRKGLPLGLQSPENIQLGADNGERGKGDEGKEEGLHRGHDTTSGPVDLSSFGVSELGELNEANIVHVLERGSHEHCREKEDVAKVVEERGKSGDGVVLLVSAQLLV